MIAGNHDAHNKMTRRLPLPENVTMLSHDQPQSFPIPEYDVMVHGQEFSTQAVTEDLSERLSASDPRPLQHWDPPHLRGGDEGHGRYAPCTVQGLVAKGYDYWALGHVHNRQTLCEAPYIAFPGNTQGRHARLGPKGCLLVTIANGGPPKVDFRRLDVVRQELCEIDAARAGSKRNWPTRPQASWRNCWREDADRLLAVRVVIGGASPIHDRLLSDPEKSRAAVRGPRCRVQHGSPLGRAGQNPDEAPPIGLDRGRRPDRGVVHRPPGASLRMNPNSKG